MIISTISVAEYCVGGNAAELPLRNLQILPFNFDHSKRAGELAKIAFEARKKSTLQVVMRNIIPNDTKLFAQADCENAVSLYLSCDRESQKIYKFLKQESSLKFRFVDLSMPCKQAFEDS